jgi:hypothetical protein
MQTPKEIYYFGAKDIPHRVTQFFPWEGHPSYLGKVYLEGPRGGKSIGFVRVDGTCHK